MDNFLGLVSAVLAANMMTVLFLYSAWRVRRAGDANASAWEIGGMIIPMIFAAGGIAYFW